MKKLFIGLILLASSLVYSAMDLTTSTTQYIDLRRNVNISCDTFTINVWFMRTGTGTVASTGSGGLTNSEPIVAKLVGESDGSNVDGNYFIGWSTSPLSRISCDYEDRNNGGNHPLTDTTVLLQNTWYMATQTYDYTTHKLYLNGALVQSSVTAAIPRGDSIQGLCFGAACNSSFARSGAFKGYIADVAFWKTALTATEILSIYNAREKYFSKQVEPSWLYAYWPLDEFPSGTNMTGATTIKDRVNSSTGTPTNTPKGYNDNYLSYP